MFHAPMERFQLELIYCFTFIFHSFHLTVVCFCLGLGQETEVTSTPTRPVENVVLTTKGLQDRNIQLLDGTMVENKGKTIN